MKKFVCLNIICYFSTVAKHEGNGKDIQNSKALFFLFLMFDWQWCAKVSG